MVIQFKRESDAKGFFEVVSKLRGKAPLLSMREGAEYRYEVCVVVTDSYLLGVVEGFLFGANTSCPNSAKILVQ